MRWLELSAAVLGLWLSSIPAASQAAEGTFRLLSFQAGADLRLGATRGDSEADVVDVHHTIAYLLSNAPAEVRGLAYVPPDMRSLIDAGSESIAAVKKVRDAVAGLKRSGGFIEPGGDFQNDVSARDLPSGEHPTQGATFSKGLDTFAPTGPYLTLAEDVPDPHNLAIEARLNGEVWDLPNSNTKHLTFKIPELIEFLSARVTLLPGDVIATGVPAPVVPLRAGDTVEITIERLGTLRNRVVAKADSRATQ